MEAVRLLPYEGPKARIAVAQFDDRTARGYARIGEGMSTMFVTALVNSNRYIVLERDIIDEVIGEQDLGASGRVLPGTEAPVGEIEGGELLLTGAVTEFEPEKFGIGSGILGLGTLITSAALNEKYGAPVGAATYTESHVAIDVRVIDLATSRIVASVSVEGSGQDWGGFIAGEVGGGMSRLPLAFGGFQKAATEKAVRKVVDLAVAAVTLQFPHEYFRHSADDFSGGRIFGYSYLDLPGVSGEKFQTPGVRTARSAGEWTALAADLGLGGARAAAPVDFAARQVVVIAVGKQGVPGKTVSVEKAVAHPEKVEITAALVDPPPSAGNKEPEDGGEDQSGLSLTPLVILSTERTELPLTVTWAEGS
jgi:curli biogenesis system outer membrane secretion channel CsgG